MQMKEEAKSQKENMRKKMEAMMKKMETCCAGSGPGGPGVSKPTGCPSEEPTPFSSCSISPSMSCPYGKECCCGRCGPSKMFQCGEGNWMYFHTDFCLRPCATTVEPTPTPVPTKCPPNQPKGGSPCAVPSNEQCFYGQECCCGKCGPSKMFQCGEGNWMYLHTDFCLAHPPQSCEGNTTTPEPTTGNTA